MNTESSSKKVGILERINSTPALVSQIIRDIPILRASVQRQIGTTSIKQQDLQNAGSAPREDSDLVDSDILTFLDEACIKRWQENSPNDLKTAFIVDLMESIRNLHNKLTVCKEWAQTKVMDSAKRLSRDLLELNTLKMEKEEMQCMTNERLCAEQSCMLLLKETEQSLRNVNYETNIVTDSIERLEASNAQTKANTEAIRLSTSEYGTKLNQALNRGIGCMKKLATVEKQTSNLRAQCDEEKQKVLRLQQDVFQAEEEAKEAEVCHFLEVTNQVTVSLNIYLNSMISFNFVYISMFFCYILFKTLILFLLLITFLRNLLLSKGNCLFLIHSIGGFLFYFLLVCAPHHVWL